MATMKLDKQQSIYVLTLTNGDQENALNQDVLNEYIAIFDEIEYDKNNASLIIQSDHAKTFCNGLDLGWLMQQSLEDKKTFTTQLENMLLRLALLNLPVIAAVNGNAYAGGAILAAACDFRFMRADKGRFCFPEVHLTIPFTDSIAEIVQLLPNQHATWEMSLTAKALTGAECLQSQVVHQIHPIESLHAEVFKFAEEMSQKHRMTYAVIKRQLRSRIVHIAKERQLYHPEKYAHAFIM
ncbi:enoyl-CoA hydratase/isomerase family protein [Acinetobacter sp. NIPH 2699]|uniref:enoyl-CoA hydratase/isomerase family protein n=1 Tax=Acinetobacter sp. NIPH 2699 TaxID=2923433 RepID=UPI001F4B9B0B|nr:enoyl-CoA hydratase/isomerase family protein [Acinetobacter sp. NIPH 2699]MCH7337211.1 enoyl-CoA hydratase/isomerase family protein [Acinetobacter sp. NIPH 2699]